jgi:hypothetical protein
MRCSFANHQAFEIGKSEQEGKDIQESEEKVMTILYIKRLSKVKNGQPMLARLFLV